MTTIKLVLKLDFELLHSAKNIFAKRKPLHPLSHLTTHSHNITSSYDNKLTKTLPTCTPPSSLHFWSTLTGSPHPGHSNRTGHKGQPWRGLPLTPGDQQQAAGEEWSPPSRCCGLERRSVHGSLTGWLQAAQLDWLSFIQFSGRMGSEESVIIYECFALSSNTCPK